MNNENVIENGVHEAYLEKQPFLINHNFSNLASTSTYNLPKSPQVTLHKIIPIYSQT